MISFLGGLLNFVSIDQIENKVNTEDICLKI